MSTIFCSDSSEHVQPLEGMKLKKADILANKKGLQYLPPIQRMGKVLTADEIIFMKEIIPIILEKEPTLTIVKVCKFLSINRGTFNRHFGHLRHCFNHSITRSSPLKKVSGYKAQVNNKRLNLVKRIFTFRNQENYACMVCGITSHAGHSFLEIAEIDHVDRNRKNNNFSNLRVICSTCHAMCTHPFVPFHVKMLTHKLPT